MGWASGLNAGRQLGNTLIDTYEQARQEREFGRIRDEQPQVSEGFTAEQGDQLRAAADSGMYDVGFKNGRYTVTPKSEPGNEGFVAPQQVTDMFGERRAGLMSPRQVEYQRQAQMAGAVSRRNPLAGARMMRELDQGEREQAQHELGMKTGNIALERATRQNRQEGELEDFNNTLGQNTVKYLQDPTLLENAILGLNSSHNAVTISDPQKDGTRRIGIVGKNGRETVSYMQPYQIAHAAGLIETMHRFPGQAPTILRQLYEIDKNVAEVVARDNKLKLDVFGAETKAIHDDRTGRAALMSASAAQQRAANENAALKKLDEQVSLGKEAAGQFQGLQLARHVGPTDPKVIGEGNRTAEQIYSEELANTNARLQAIGGRGIGVQEKPQLPAADLKSYLEMFGDTDVGMKAGKKVKLRELPPAEQIRYIESNIQRRQGSASGGLTVNADALANGGEAPDPTTVHLQQSMRRIAQEISQARTREELADAQARLRQVQAAAAAHAQRMAPAEPAPRLFGGM